MTMSLPHQGCSYLFHPSRHGHHVQNISLVTIFHTVISIQICIIIFVIVVIIIVLNLQDGAHANRITP